MREDLVNDRMNFEKEKNKFSKMQNQINEEFQKEKDLIESMKNQLNYEKPRDN